MKKLLAIFFGITLVMGFMISPAAAQNPYVGFDFDLDGVVDATGDMDLSSCAGNPTTVDVYLTNWDAMYANEDIFGVTANVCINPAELTLVGGLAGIINFDETQGGPWNSAFNGNVDNGGGCYDIAVGNFDCAPYAGDQVKIATIQLECAGVQALPSTVTATPVAFITGGPACGGSAAIAGDPSQIDITIDYPPCEMNITPGSGTYQSSPTPFVAETFGIVETGGCSGTDNLTFTTDCVAGAVDASTGAFTVSQSFVPETCTVSVTDADDPGTCVDCTAEITINPVVLCFIEIYEGGYPVPPLNTFSKPGRRGIALTCGDTVQFTTCTNCDPNDPNQNNPVVVWSVIFHAAAVPAGTTITQGGLLTVGPDCANLTKPGLIRVCATDTANNNIQDCVDLWVGEVVLKVEDMRAQPGTQGVDVTVSLDNLDHAVKAIQSDIQDLTGNLTCTGCTPDPYRAPEYICSTNMQPDGDCRVIMVSTNPAALINQGTGAVMTIQYDVAAGASAEDCITVVPSDSVVTDEFGDALCICEVSGDICFIMCGDVYPRDCLSSDPNCDRPNCGDGVVDIFDILEEIDFALGIVGAYDPGNPNAGENMSLCQTLRADVPTGTPPYCSDPDGTIDVLDVLVIIDMALGKANCCDYYYFGSIY